MKGRKPHLISLSEAERMELQRLIGSGKTEQRIARGDPYFVYIAAAFLFLVFRTSLVIIFCPKQQPILLLFAKLDKSILPFKLFGVKIKHNPSSLNITLA